MEKILCWIGLIVSFIGLIWSLRGVGSSIDKENEDMAKWRKERYERPYLNNKVINDNSLYEERKRNGYYDVNTSDM